MGKVVLTFQINRELFDIIIDNREVFYKDRKMPKPTRLIPVDERIKLKVSRNIVPKDVVEQFNLTPEEKLEYDNAKGEKELIDLCKRDACKSGGILIKQEVISDV